MPRAHEDHTSLLFDGEREQLLPPVVPISQTEAAVRSAQEVVNALRSSGDGLDKREVLARLIQFGPNTPPKAAQRSLVVQFLINLLTGFAPLLWAASILCFIAWRPLGGDNPDPSNLSLAILLVVVIIFQAIFGLIQEYSARKFDPGTLQTGEVQVRRNQAIVAVSPRDLVIGDILVLNAGASVQADVRIIEAIELRVNKSSLTGEALPVPLTSARMEDASCAARDAANLALFGCEIVEGHGLGVVVATGADTELGRTADLAKHAPTRSSPVQREINRFVLIITLLAFCTGLLTFLTWYFDLRVHHPDYMNVPGMVINMISLIVAYVPEGMPISITLTLRNVAKRMGRLHLKVKQLSSVETLGCASVILSDKTGTLTSNLMTVVQYAVPAGEPILVPSMYTKKLTSASSSSSSSSSTNPSGAIDVAHHHHDHQRLPAQPLFRGLLRDALMCILATNTSATDRAIRTLGEANNIFLETLDAACKTVFISPFSSATKRMIMVREVCFQGNAARTGTDPQNNMAVNNDNNSSSNNYSSNNIQDYDEVLDFDDPGDLDGRGSSGNNTTSSSRQKGFVLYIKGASEAVLPYCTLQVVLRDTVATEVLSLQQIDGVVRQLSSQGQRVIAVASRRVSPQEVQALQAKEMPIEKLLSGLVFKGLLALEDPPRPDVRAAIGQCRQAGVRVAMVTGDHPDTAWAIAKQIGLVMSEAKHTHEDMPLDFLPPVVTTHPPPPTTAAAISTTLTRMRSHGGLSHTINSTQAQFNSGQEEQGEAALILHGADLEHLSETNWQWIIHQHREVVFARTTPEQKLRIVQAYQRAGHIVAVTGDGVNDAAALRCADIGVAMGSGGTDAAQAAAGIVLMNNSFASIVEGIKQGRLVFDNMKKVVTYLLPAGSWSEMLPVMFAVFLGMPQPLSAFQMIIICMLTDFPISLSLVMEKAEADIMHLPPRNTNTQHLVDWRLLLYAYGNIGMIESLGAFVLFLQFMHDYGGVRSTDLFFAYDSWPDNIPHKDGVDLTEIWYQGQTVFFVALVITQFGNALAVRTRRVSGLPFLHETNRWMFVGMLASLCIALLAVYCPPLQSAINTRDIPAAYWFLPLIPAVSIFAWDEVRKYCVRNGVKGLRHVYW